MGNGQMSHLNVGSIELCELWQNMEEKLQQEVLDTVKQAVELGLRRDELGYSEGKINEECEIDGTDYMLRKMDTSSDYMLRKIDTSSASMTLSLGLNCKSKINNTDTCPEIQECEIDGTDYMLCNGLIISKDDRVRGWINEEGDVEWMPGPGGPKIQKCKLNGTDYMLCNGLIISKDVRVMGWINDDGDVEWM